MIDLVAQDEKRDFGELFHGKKGVEFGLRLGETLKVFGVYEEDYAGDFGEIVFPETPGLWSGVSIGKRLWVG